MNLPRLFNTVLLLLLLAVPAQADLRVANVFGDHMVLQQEMPIRVWGWAKPGATVVVGLSDNNAVDATSVKAGDDGKWLVQFKPRKAAGKALELEVASGDKKVTFKDILLGEVWICSGQSNMEWPVRACANAEQEIAAANYPTIRLFNVPQHIKQNTPQEDAQQASWSACSPQTVANFSAAGYYFGRALSEQLDVPIGLVGTNWGGTRIEPWTPPVGFQQVAALQDITAKIAELDPTTEAGQGARLAYMRQVEAWLAQSKQNLVAGRDIGSAPQFNLNPPGGATQIYNGMVAGLTPMSARGVIWYQGESNAGDGLRYDQLKEALVKGWRSVFQNEDLSFYWVQLANFRQPDNNPAGGGWGPVREGQRRALRLPNTGMAVIIDIGNAGDIHPKNKQDVGKRLAHLALAKNYGKDVVASGPLYKSHTIEANKVRVRFDYLGGGLMVGKKAGQFFLDPTQEVKDGELGEFALRDDQGNWHWAKAVIDGDSVVVSSDQVNKPTAVRYAYQSNPVNANLYNKAGLPASPFTTAD